MYQALSVTVAPDNAGLDFGLIIQGEVQHFRISLEALRDQFGADEADDDDALLDCFLDGEQVICAKAFALSTIPPQQIQSAYNLAGFLRRSCHFFLFCVRFRSADLELWIQPCAPCADLYGEPSTVERRETLIRIGAGAVKDAQVEQHYTCT
ncbi:hypothetical protein [Paraburkholderia sp. 22B1P]|uniref:hypothetical protein n=1 Tax=Paraburkholderia sp. 22B1P TaxID=3080498 RepID=UPI0030930F9D|nr:hypothetical protein PBP221_84330 [Paraburkholderia sp. 22B1P]